MCSTDCSRMHGGAWSNNNVNGSGQKLYQWLIVGSDSGLIKRGYLPTDLNTSKTGQNVAEQLKNAVSLTPSSTEGSLQKVLCGFMFVCSWDDALTGHACLFLHKFCDEVGKDSGNAFRGTFEEKYSGKTYEELKGECSTLKSQLDPFVSGTSKLYAVCQKNTDLFKDLWDDGKFDKYCDWLKRNIYRIIGALVSMSQDCPDWDLSSLQSASSAGPFKYGFVFKGSWTSGSTSMSKLQGYISKLVNSDSGSLQKFISFLFNPSTPSSAGATAGGVVTGLLGTGGLGAGAAYGLNLFGFKNLVTGFLK